MSAEVGQPKKLIPAAAALAFIGTTMTVSAQTQTTDARLGKLRFENGFPTKETVIFKILPRRRGRMA